MKKLINTIPMVVRQSLEGLVALNSQLALLEGENTVVRSDIEAFQKSGKVAVLTGGGAGHEPAHAGYVGRGMLTAAVSGDVFASPSTDAVYAAIKAVAGPAGVLVIVKNYTGDRLNFGLAAELARAEGIDVELAVVSDDAALGGAERMAGRRGIAGTVLVHKVAGAAAEAGLSLVEVKAAADSAIAAVASMGVALSACTVPAAGKANFTLGDDEIELGLGIHGEPGVRRSDIAPSAEIVRQLLDTIIADRNLVDGDRVALLVNNLGATPVMELGIVANDALAQLSARGIKVERAWSGTFLTAIDMAGISLSLMRVDDAILTALDAPANAPSWPTSSAPIAASATISRPTDKADAYVGTGVVAPDAFFSALEKACRALVSAEPELTEMDRLVGDGDIGHSLSAGANALLEAVGDWRGQPIDRVLHQVGMTLRRVVGGTSGPLYAAFAIAASQTMQEGSADLAAFARAFVTGTEAITRLGGAQAGDRTMVDALLPAAAVLAASGQLADAAFAARKGADATAQMQPRRGRSSYIGERVIGHPDPGAVAVAILIETIAQ